MTEQEREDYQHILANEEERVERLMTAQEIFEVGFKLGLAKAGLTGSAEWVWLDWLLARVDQRVIHDL